MHTLATLLAMAPQSLGTSQTQQSSSSSSSSTSSSNSPSTSSSSSSSVSASPSPTSSSSSSSHSSRSGTNHRTKINLHELRLSTFTSLFKNKEFVSVYKSDKTEPLINTLLQYDLSALLIDDIFTKHIAEITPEFLMKRCSDFLPGNHTETGNAFWNYPIIRTMLHINHHLLRKHPVIALKAAAILYLSTPSHISPPTNDEIIKLLINSKITKKLSQEMINDIKNIFKTPTNCHTDASICSAKYKNLLTYLDNPKTLELDPKISNSKQKLLQACVPVLLKAQTCFSSISLLPNTNNSSSSTSSNSSNSSNNESKKTSSTSSVTIHRH